MTEPVTVTDLAATWRAEADRLERFAPAAAVAFRDAAQQLEQALRDAAGETLTLAEAASVSGYSSDRLRHLLANGTIPNCGEKHRPRVRRADLPVKATKAATRTTPTAYSVDADARHLVQRGRR